MALSHEDKEELKEIIRGIVQEELSNFEHPCKIAANPEDQKEVELFIAQVQNLGGDGRLSTAAEIIRDNHRWLYKQRQRGESLNLVIYGLLITALVSGFLSMLWIGFKKLVHAE